MNYTFWNKALFVLGVISVLAFTAIYWINPFIMDIGYLSSSSYSIAFNIYTALIILIILGFNTYLRKKDFDYLQNRSLSSLLLAITAAGVTILCFFWLQTTLNCNGPECMVAGFMALPILGIIVTSFIVAAISFRSFSNGFKSESQKWRWDILYPFGLFIAVLVLVATPNLDGFFTESFPCGTQCRNTDSDTEELVDFLLETKKGSKWRSHYLSDPYIGLISFNQIYPWMNASTQRKIALERSNPEICRISNNDGFVGFGNSCYMAVVGEDEDAEIQRILSNAKRGNTAECSRLLPYDELAPTVHHEDISIFDPYTKTITHDKEADIIVPFASRERRFFDIDELEKYYLKSTDEKPLVQSDYYDIFESTHFTLTGCRNRGLEEECVRNQDGVFVPSVRLEDHEGHISHNYHPPRKLMTKYLKPQLFSEEYCRNLSEGI